jgi:hypothetical protein
MARKRRPAPVDRDEGWPSPGFRNGSDQPLTACTVRTYREAIVGW